MNQRTPSSNSAAFVQWRNLGARHPQQPVVDEDAVFPGIAQQLAGGGLDRRELADVPCV